MPRCLKIDPLGEGARLTRTLLAIHRAVLPLNGELSPVPDGVERTDDLLEVDLAPAPAHAPEVPVAAGIAEGHMSSENPYLFGCVAPVDILHMYMEDLFGELVDEIHYNTPRNLYHELSKD